MNRIEHLFGDSRSPGQRVKAAAHELEAVYAAAIRAASCGQEFDVSDLLALGASCGRTPFHVWADVRIASAAYDAWLNSVPMLTS